MERELYYENNINIGLYHLHNDLMGKLDSLYSRYIDKYEDDGEVCEAIGDLFVDIDNAIGEFLADTNFKDEIKNTVKQAYLEGKINGVKDYVKKKGE